MNHTFALFLTPSAQKHFKKMIGDSSFIKLSLKNSGCSGYAYVLETEDKHNSNEQPLARFNEIDFYIPEEQKKAFNNTVIDYKKDGLNYKLVFDNPNAENECGCGESFSIKV
jgi:iron-sulfur cluster assembly accessory protein